MGIELYFETLERLTPQLRAGDLAGCEAGAVAALRALPATPFRIATDLDITNDPVRAARRFDDFVRREAKRLPVGAVYAEMNAFDVNPKRWYCDLFSYMADGGLDDLDWLARWHSEPSREYTILGLERLQAVYAGQASADPANADARAVCDAVVLTKFQRFVQRAAERMSAVRVPLYVTVHDSDFVARLTPGA